MKRGFQGDRCHSYGLQKVAWGEGQMATGEATLATTGLAICIGIAIYDPTIGRGYMAHILAGANNFEEAAVPMAEAAAIYSPDASQLRAWVRGGTLAKVLIPRPAGDRRLREKTTSLLKYVGVPLARTDTRWNNNSHTSVDIRLRCKDGQFTSTSPYQLVPNDL